MIAALLAQAAAAPAMDPLIDSLMKAGPLGVCIIGAWLLWPKVTAWRQVEIAAAKDRDAAFIAANRERDAAFLSGQRELSTAFSAANERILDRADKMHERSIAAIDHVREELSGLRADVHSLTTGTFPRQPSPAKE